MVTISPAKARGKNSTKRKGDSIVGATIVDLAEVRERKFRDPREWIFDLTKEEIVGVAADTTNLHAANENFFKILRVPQTIRIKKGEEDEMFELPVGAQLTVFRKLRKVDGKGADGWKNESSAILAAVIIRRSPVGRDTQITIRMDGRVSMRDLQPL